MINKFVLNEILHHVGMCWKWTNMLQTRAPSEGAWTRTFLPYIKPSLTIQMQLHVEIGWDKLWVQPGEDRKYICIRTVRNITGYQGTCERCLGRCIFDEKRGERSLTFSSLSKYTQINFNNSASTTSLLHGRDCVSSTVCCGSSTPRKKWNMKLTKVIIPIGWIKVLVVTQTYVQSFMGKYLKIL